MNRITQADDWLVPDSDVTAALAQLRLLSRHGDVGEGAAGASRGIGALVHVTLRRHLSTERLQLHLIRQLTNKTQR